MATTATKKEISVAEKLDALYQLQLIDSEIDRIRTIRGELPLEVQDLEERAKSKKWDEKVSKIFAKELNFENTIWRGAADGVLYFESRQHQLAKIWPESYIFWAKDRSTGYIQVSVFLLIIAMSLLAFKNKTNN